MTSQAWCAINWADNRIIGLITAHGWQLYTALGQPTAVISHSGYQLYYI